MTKKLKKHHGKKITFQTWAYEACWSTIKPGSFDKVSIKLCLVWKWAPWPCVLWESYLKWSHFFPCKELYFYRNVPGGCTPTCVIDTQRVHIKQVSENNYEVRDDKTLNNFYNHQDMALSLAASKLHLRLTQTKTLWVIHLPARPESQTHNFPKRYTNLDPDASHWTQKNYCLSIMIMVWWLFFSIFEKFQNTYQSKQHVIVKWAPLHSSHYRLNFHDQRYFTEAYVFRFHTCPFCFFLLAFVSRTFLFKLNATEEKT